MQNKHGDTMLTNISHMPIIDGHDEPQGAVMIIDDISKIAEMQTELKRKEEELEQLDDRFQETYTQLKLADQEKKANTGDLTRIRMEMGEKTKEITDINSLLQERQRELQSLNESIQTKTGELSTIATHLEENKTTLTMVETGLQKKQKELELIEQTDKMPSSDIVKHKLTLSDEIDKCLDITEENLKTKKFDDDQ